MTSDTWSMPIPCEACGCPVHAKTVTCPHCGEATGVVPDHSMDRAENAALLANDPLSRPIVPNSAIDQVLTIFPELGVLAVGAAVVTAAVEAVVETVKDQRAMGAIGKQDKVRTALTEGRAAMLDAIGAIDTGKTSARLK